MSVRLDTAKLDQIIAKFPGESEEVVQKGALAVQALAAKLAPRDTGNLSDNIEAKPKGKLLWWVEDGTDYGIYQELGFNHYGSGAFIQNAFMRPAVERVQKQYTALWVTLFNRL